MSKFFKLFYRIQKINLNISLKNPDLDFYLNLKFKYLV